MSSRGSKYLLAFAAAAAAGGAYYYSTLAAAAPPKPVFSGDWVDLKLKRVRDVTHDTKLFTFEYPDKKAVSGLVTASLVFAKYVTEKGNNVVRPYTPVTDPAQQGSFDLLVKIYPTGKFGNHLAGLKPSDSVSFKGPIVKWKWEPNQFSHVTLIGGGSGITPLYQIINEVLRHKEDKTKITLLFGNQTPEDILLKPELDALAKDHPDQLEIKYFVDKASGAFDGKVGYITKDDVKAAVKGPSPDTHVFICGPPGLYKAVSGAKVSARDQGEVGGVLAELGYDKTQVFKF